MSDQQQEAFLSDGRYGILTTLRDDGAPVSLPVWFEWDGKTVRMFAHEASGKIKRLRNDPRASLLVVNHPHEPEHWVSFDGKVAIRDNGGIELGERLLDRYYPQGDARRAEIESWRKMADEWRLLELTPDAIRVHKE